MFLPESDRHFVVINFTSLVCYDLILTNCKNNFQNTTAFFTGFSDFHKMTTTVLKTEYVKADPVQINYRDYKRYNSIDFRDELRNKLMENTSIHNDYSSFQNILSNVLNKHAPVKKKYLRANDSPFMTKNLRKMIMNRSRYKNAYTKNKTVENWENIGNFGMNALQKLGRLKGNTTKIST